MSATLRQSCRRFLCIVFLGLFNAATPGQEFAIGPSIDVGGTGAETHIAVNPCDPSYAVGVWKTTSPPRMVSTDDAGSDGTWDVRSIPGGQFGDPTMAFHPFGAFAFNGAQGNQTGNCTGVVDTNGVRRVSTTSVSGFSNVVDDVCGVDRTWISSGPSSVLGPATVYLYFAYTDADLFTSTPLSIARAVAIDNPDDQVWVNNTIWEHSVFVSPTDGVLPAMAVGPDGAVHLVYVKPIGPLGGTAMHTLSTQDGAPTTWLDPPQVVEAGTQQNLGPRVGGGFRVAQSLGHGVDPNDGTLYLSFTSFEPDPPGDSDDVNIYVRKGVPDGMGGYTWEPRKVASPPSTDPACDTGIHLDQFFSALYVDDRGWVHLVWQEACDTGSSPNPDVFTVYAYSSDGGDTFIRNRLNQDDPLLQPGAGTFIGDYIGIAGAGNKVYALYPSGTEIAAGEFEIDSTRIDIGLNEADLDGSGVVDLTDYATFCGCFSGADNNPAPGCFFGNLDTDCDVDSDDGCLFEVIGGWLDCCGDFDGDGAVNLVDFATFALCLGTPPPGSGACPAADFACAEMTGDCKVDLVDFAAFSVLFNTSPVHPDCELTFDCAGESAAAQGGGPQPDYSALAEWTIANIPASGRQLLANRARQQAAQNTDAAERNALLDFANAIEP